MSKLTREELELLLTSGGAFSHLNDEQAKEKCRVIYDLIYEEGMWAPKPDYVESLPEVPRSVID
jgi:hypothetical protein